ncbi:MAG: putative Holliday junction resolvase [Parvicella sp.]|jgi:putative Holliday junction resolvase
MSRIISIDYGTKRVGLAATDDLQIIASGLTTIHSNELIAYLQKFVADNDVEAIVLGEPKTLRNEATDSSVEIEKLRKHLVRTFPSIPIQMVDERFTSKMASHVISQSGMSKKKRQNKALVDEISAVIILQDYMTQKGNGLR